MQTTDDMPSPDGIFGRDAQWRALTDFAASNAAHPTLGLVYGRRLQGKSTLLRALAGATGGFYHAAAPYSGGYPPNSAGALGRLRADLAAYRDDAAPPLRDWSHAMEVLLELGADRETTVVLDNVAELAAGDPKLAETIGRAFDPERATARSSRTRLLLGGSAVGYDKNPLLRHKALRQHAALRLRLDGFDYRTAAAWWGMDDPLVAVPVYCVVGGTPIHRDWADDIPKGPGDVEAWVKRTVYHPKNELFAEGSRIHHWEPGPRFVGHFRAIPAAICYGLNDGTTIARKLRTSPDGLRRYLTVLEASGLVERRADAFGGGWLYRVAEPLYGFYIAMMRNRYGRLRRGYFQEFLWKQRQHRFKTMVLERGFAQICRVWAQKYAPADQFADAVTWVGRGFVPCPGPPPREEANVVVFGPKRDGRQRLLSIGLTSWTSPVTGEHLDRLRRIRAFLADTGRYDLAGAGSALYTGAGSSDEVTAATERGEVSLVTPELLYR